MSRVIPPRESEVEHESNTLEQWKSIASQQEDLFARVLQDNEDLKKQLELVKFDYNNMKLAITALNDQIAAKESLTVDLATELAEAKRTAITFESARNLVLILLDGDGYIFQSDLLKNGSNGGRQAATMLSNGVARHLANQGTNLPKVTLWCMTFVSRERLENVLVKTDTCSAEQFKLFIKGFSQAHPLFSLVEVGANKEAADYKLREHLSEFIGNPKILQVVVGVDHDNGYSAALSAALTSGYRDRLVLLQAHQEIAREIRALNLTTFYIDGLFLERSLQMITPPGLARPPQTTSWASAASTTTHTNSPPPMTPKAYTVTATPSKPFSPVTPRGGDMKLIKRDPAPCNFHYLSGNCTNPNCTYGHGYVLSDDEKQGLANFAKLQPCQYVNGNGTCFFKNCFYGHRCPRGPQCSYRRAGTCKFKGETMHDP